MSRPEGRAAGLRAGPVPILGLRGLPRLAKPVSLSGGCDRGAHSVGQRQILGDPGT